MQHHQTSNKISGFHHLATTGDIKGQIDFFTDARYGASIDVLDARRAGYLACISSLE